MESEKSQDGLMQRRGDGMPFYNEKNVTGDWFGKMVLHMACTECPEWGEPLKIEN